MRWGLFLVLFLFGCAQVSTVELRGKSFRVELARTPAEQAKGLMFRTELADDAGMLFLFDDEAPRAFWMKNCKIPLDILYFDSQWRLVGKSLNTPPCNLGDRCPSYPSGAPARYVLELRGGLGEEMGVILGDRLEYRP